MKVVQETLGLSSVTIAADTYTSVLPDLARQSAEDAAAIILTAAKKNRKPTVKPAPSTPIGSAPKEEIDRGDTVEEVS
jgi:hypothetical protein